MIMHPKQWSKVMMALLLICLLTEVYFFFFPGSVIFSVGISTLANHVQVGHISNIERNADNTIDSGVFQHELLRPPSQEWIAEQFEAAYKSLNSTYTPPTDWRLVRKPQTYYFPNINVIFTGIPKNGCSNWLEAFLRAEGRLGESLDRTKVAKVHSVLSHKYRMSNLMRWNGTYDARINTATSILVLRNPWVRAVSAFTQKLSKEKVQGASLVGIRESIVEAERNLSSASGLYPTFEEFVRYSVRNARIKDRHFAAQYQYMSIDVVRYDWVIPLEFAESFSQTLFKDKDIDMFGSYDSQSDPRVQSSVLKAKEWFSGLDPELVEDFYKLYRGDFKFLNYSNFTDPHFPLPLF